MKYVGRTEKVSFPELGIETTDAKVDTGAYGNALHVDEIFIKDDKLFFIIDEKEYVYEKYKTIVVRNSFGKKQKRFSMRILKIFQLIFYEISITKITQMPTTIFNRCSTKKTYLITQYI